MQRRNTFNYGFDEKPDFVKRAEQEEENRLRLAEEARQGWAHIARLFDVATDGNQRG